MRTDKYRNFKFPFEVKGKGTISIGKFTAIDSSCALDSDNNKNSFIRIGERSKLKHGVILKTYNGYIDIGDRVTIGEYSIIAGHGGVSIGDYTIIAGLCYISAQNHIHESNIPFRFQGETAKGIHIDTNVWIGGRVTITDGVHIGRNSVIGAGSVVTKDVPNNSIVVGVPGKVIKHIAGEESS